MDKAAQDQDAPAWVVAVVLRKPMGQHAWPTVVGVSCNDPVALGEGARKRAPGTPTMWNDVIRTFTRPVLGASAVAHVIVCRMPMSSQAKP